MELRGSAEPPAERSSHVMRRDGDPVLQWAVERWSVTVVDVLGGGVNGYGDRVQAWAEAVIADLDAVEAVDA